MIYEEILEVMGINPVDLDPVYEYKNIAQFESDRKQIISILKDSKFYGKHNNPEDAADEILTYAMEGEFKRIKSLFNGIPNVC